MAFMAKYIDIAAVISAQTGAKPIIPFRMNNIPFCGCYSSLSTG